LFAFEYAFNKLVMSGDIAAPALPLNVVVTQSPEIVKSRLVKQKNNWVFYINPGQRYTQWTDGYHDLVHLLTTSMIVHVGPKQSTDQGVKIKPDTLVVKLSKVYEDIIAIVKQENVTATFNNTLKRFGYKNIKQVPLASLPEFLKKLSFGLAMNDERVASGLIHGLRNDVLDINPTRPNADNQREDTKKYTRVHYGVSDRFSRKDILTNSLGGQPQYYVEETIGNSLQAIVQVKIEKSEPIEFGQGEKFLKFLAGENQDKFKELYDTYGGQEIVDYILQVMPKLEQLYNTKLTQITIHTTNKNTIKPPSHSTPKIKTKH
jgi:hypothetical protein